MRRGLQALLVSACLAGTASGQCAGMAGKWYDEASEDAMTVSEADCQLTSKYGTAKVTVDDVAPLTGILRALGLSGHYNSAGNFIQWTNGIRWTKMSEKQVTTDFETRLTTAESKVTEYETRIKESETRLTGAESKATECETKMKEAEARLTESELRTTKAEERLTELEKLVTGLPEITTAIAELRTKTDELAAAMNKGGVPITFAPTTAMPATDTPATTTPTGTPATGVPATGTPATGTPATQVPPTAAATTAPGTAGTAAPTVDYATALELQELRDLVAQMNTTGSGEPGRDGYCSVQPNVTSVYIPVARYMFRSNAGDVCVTGPVASVGPPGSVGVPSLKVTPQITNQNCRWTSRMQDRMYAYKGDTLVFWRGTDKGRSIWLMENEQKFKKCDFTGAKLLAGLLDLESMEMRGKNFTFTLSEAGSYFFASDKAGYSGDERIKSCWNPVDGKYPGQDKAWGDATKTEVVVLDPTTEVMAQCPLYDPSKYGASNGGGQIDSESVERLKGAVAAMGRQLIATEIRTQERVRYMGNSGITQTRSGGQGTDSFFSGTYVGGGVANIHNHANNKFTVGMGEFAAVLNGVQFNTRHNDYSLEKADPTLTVEQYQSSWPPKSTPISLPEVPPSVLAKSSVPDQVTEMREYFRAYKLQDPTIRDYRPFFKAKLCYLEGTWAEAQDNIAEPFASDRHQIDADSWSDLNQKNAFLMNNGQKLSLENLPYLPTSFRDMWTRDDGSTFEPRMAQYFYRIKCMDIAEDVPTARFRVRQDLHIQLGAGKPQTREQLSTSRRALFDINPVSMEDYRPTNPWPVGKTTWEYMDELMARVPGFDGPNGNLIDDSLGPTCATYDGKETLNTAFYTRYYSMLEKDAMGQSKKKRSFNDYMFAARTTHKRVSPQEACAEVSDETGGMTKADESRQDICKAMAGKQLECQTHAGWAVDDVSGTASGAKCVYLPGKQCVYKKCWEQRWSYAIPLEIIYTTPLSDWNPYNIEYFEKGDAGYDAVAKGRNGRDKPYIGGSRKYHFITPAEFFTSVKTKDPADTSGGETNVLDSKGKSRKV